MGMLIGKILGLVVCVLTPVVIWLLIKWFKARKARIMAQAQGAPLAAQPVQPPAAGPVAPAQQAPAQLVPPMFMQRMPGAPPSMFKTLLVLGAVVVALVLIAAGSLYFYSQYKAGRGAKADVVAVDPCTKCKPSDLSVAKLDKDDNYLWSGACNGDDPVCVTCTVTECKAVDDEKARSDCRCKK